MSDRVLHEGADRRFRSGPKARVGAEAQTSRPIDELVRRMSAQYAHVRARVAGSGNQLRPRRVGSWPTLFGPAQVAEIFWEPLRGSERHSLWKQLSYRCNEPEQSCSISGAGNQCSSTAWSARQGHPEIFRVILELIGAPGTKPRQFAGLHHFRGPQSARAYTDCARATSMTLLSFTCPKPRWHSCT